MEQKSCFKLVTDQFPQVSALKWFEVSDPTSRSRSNSQRLTLFGWHRCDVIVFQLTQEMCKNLKSPLAEPCAFERIPLSNEVLDVVQYKNSIFVVDCGGNLFSLYLSSDNEDDLFDDVPLSHVWQVNHVMKVGSFAFASCSTSSGVAVLHRTDERITVSTVTFDLRPRVKSEAIIQNYPQTTCSDGDFCSKSMMFFISREEIDHEILSSLLPSYDTPFMGLGIIIVGFPNGMVCCLVMTESDLTPHFVMKWPFHPVAGFLSSSPKNVPSRKSLKILFDGGTLAQFSDFSLEYSYIPLRRIKTANFNGQTVVTSDFFDTYVSRFAGDNLTSFVAPLKGVVCFCPLSITDSTILAATKHCTLYVLSLGEEASENVVYSTERVPEEGLFDKFVGLSQHLEQINQKIQARDRYLSAMSVAMSFDHLVFNFDVQVIAVYGNIHLLRVIVQNRMPEIILSSQVWHLMISLFSSTKCLTFVRDLERDLSSDAPLEDVYKFELTGDDRDFTVHGRLIANTGSNEKYWPSLKIGEASLGIENYVQPISCSRIQEMLTSQPDDLIFESSAATRELTSTESRRKENCSFTIFDAQPEEGWLQDFLGKSRALWRFSEWKTVGESEKVDVLIGRDKYSFLKSDYGVQVTGSNVVKCYLLKLAMLRSLKRMKLMVPADEPFLMEIENILKELEIYEFTVDLHSPDVLKTVFNRKEEFVMKHLIGSQSFLPT